MTDAEKREKVFRGLECCSQQRGGPELCEQCPYDNGPVSCATALIRDALVLLKEQEAKWIPVTERLPGEKISPMTMDYTEYPCVFDDRSGQREVRYYKFGKGHFWHGPECIDEYVTHWAEPMPLPEPPKGEENAEL